MTSSNDPYAGGVDYDANSQMGDWEEPRRTSIPAVLSLISALLICPLIMQLLGILFGIIGVVSISMSGGKRKGMGLAVSGIVISLVVLGLYTVGAFKLVDLGKELGKYPDSMMTALYSDDLTEVRTWFSPAANQAIDDAEFQELRRWMESEYGVYADCGVHWSISTFEKINRTLGQQQYQNEAPIPTLFTFDRMDAEALVIYEPQQAPTDPAKIFLVDRIIFVDNNGDLREFPAASVITPVISGETESEEEVPDVEPVEPAPDEEDAAEDDGKVGG